MPTPKSSLQGKGLSNGFRVNEERPLIREFADRLITRVRELGHPLCLGLDPHLKLMPEAFRDGGMSPGAPQTVEAVREFLRLALERATGKVAIVKPQSAFFEVHGSPGIQLLEETISYAKELGFLVLLDAKRGDIGSTAEAYAEAYLSQGSRLAVDALTVNPYLGMDTLSPFLKTCLQNDSGLFTLVKTSNPGSADFQDIQLDGKPLYLSVAAALQPMEKALIGETGWSANGIVVGATYPGEAEAVRAVLPKSLFLVPGYGSQGGSAKDAVKSFTAGPNGLEGGVVNSSRAILFPSAGQTGTVKDWEAAFDAALNKAVIELSEAVSL